MKHSKTCQLADYTSADGLNPHLLLSCYKPAKHSIVIRSIRYKNTQRLVYRFCDEHFYILKNTGRTKEAPTECSTVGNTQIVGNKGDDLTFNDYRVQFRENRL